MRWFLALFVVLGGAALPHAPSTPDIQTDLGVFRWIPPGEGVHGPPSASVGFADEVRRQVTIQSGFYLMEREVTQAQWQSVLGTNPSWGAWCGPDCPVDQVSYHDVQQFIQRLRARDGLPYRLPTEAEWERAARADEDWDYAGGADPCEIGNVSNEKYRAQYTHWLSLHPAIPVVLDTCDDGASGPTPSCRYNRNAWGLCDMTGNLWEWVADPYERYPADAAIDPVNQGLPSQRVVRGGSWGNPSAHGRVWNRAGAAADTRHKLVGFRLALPATGPATAPRLE